MNLPTILDTIPGWLDAKEAELLHRLAVNVTDGCIVEIGSYKGRSTLVLATAAKVPVYSIDPHIPSDNEQFGDADRIEWMQNILNAGVADKVRPINLKSSAVAKIWDEPISLLFIDGSHIYQDVLDDLMQWLPHVKIGGYIAAHDSEWRGVKAALCEFRDQFPVQDVERIDSTTVLEVIE